MPLTKSGDKTLASFISEYGEEKGKEYFYRYMNKHPEMGVKFHATTAGKKKYTKKIGEMGK